MDDIDGRELERRAIKVGEIDPEKYSRKRAECLFAVLGLSGGFIAILKLLPLLGFLF